MEKNKLIVIVDPITYFQRCLALVDGQLVDQIGVKQEDLMETIEAYIQKYNIVEVDITGPQAYAQKYVRDLSDPTKYNQITVNYCGGTK